MKDDKTIIYAIERLGGMGEAIKKLPQTPAVRLGESSDVFLNAVTLSHSEDLEEINDTGRQPYSTESTTPQMPAGKAATPSPASYGTPAENTRLFNALETMSSHWLETTGSDTGRDGARPISTTGATTTVASIPYSQSAQDTGQALDGTGKFIPFAGTAQNFAVSDVQPKEQENAFRIETPEAASGISGEKPTVSISYPQEQKEQQPVADLFQRIASFSDKQANTSEFEDLMKMINAAVGENKEDGKVQAQPTESNQITGDSFREPPTDSGRYIESAMSSIGNRGEMTTHFHFNLSDSFVGNMQSSSDSSTSNQETTDDFTLTVAGSLLAVLQQAVEEKV